MTDDELKKMFDAIRRDIASADEKNVAAHVETRRHFDIALETSDHKVLLVAEGVAQTREDLARATEHDHGCASGGSLAS